jgi:hypothetical protein
MDLLAHRCRGQPGRPHVIRVGHPADELALVENLDDPRHHGGIQPLKLRQFGQAERPAAADERENRVLGRRQALAGGRVVELTGEPGDDSAQPCNEFGVHGVLRIRLECLPASNYCYMT